jgi:hypothetical protein
MGEMMSNAVDDDEDSLSYIYDEVIPSDFHVDLIFKVKDRALFAAKRKFHWHFVRATSETIDSFTNNDIAQRHIPRFLMCEVISSLKRFDELVRDENNNGLPLSSYESDQVGMYSVDLGRYNIDLIKTPEGLPNEFCEFLEEDLAVFELAKSKVKFENDLYVLPRSKSYTKKTVASKSRRLIEAIAFERETCKKLDARQFGIYSAFCTWKDFCEDVIEERHFYEELVDGQFEYDAEDSGYGDFMDLALKVQIQLLDKPIWGVGINVDRDEAVNLLAKGMSQLTSIQLAQFTLMNGMHQGGLFLPLAQVLGLNSYEKYVEWKTDDYQPDSEEEQGLRYEIEIIKLLGELCEDID